MFKFLTEFINDYKNIDLKKLGFITNREDIDKFNWFNINEIKGLMEKWTIYFDINFNPYCAPCIEKNTLKLLNHAIMLEQEKINPILYCIPYKNIFIDKLSKTNKDDIYTFVNKFNVAEIYNNRLSILASIPRESISPRSPRTLISNDIIPIFKCGILIINQRTNSILVGEKYDMFNTITGTFYNPNYLDSSLINLCAREEDFNIPTKLEKLETLILFFS